jgi:hypothetical protein
MTVNASTLEKKPFKVMPEFISNSEVRDSGFKMKKVIAESIFKTKEMDAVISIFKPELAMQS